MVLDPLVQWEGHSTVKCRPLLRPKQRVGCFSLYWTDMGIHVFNSSFAHDTPLQQGPACYEGTQLSPKSGLRFIPDVSQHTSSRRDAVWQSSWERGRLRRRWSGLVTQSTTSIWGGGLQSVSSSSSSAHFELLNRLWLLLILHRGATGLKCLCHLLMLFILMSF